MEDNNPEKGKKSAGSRGSNGDSGTAFRQLSAIFRLCSVVYSLAPPSNYSKSISPAASQMSFL